MSLKYHLLGTFCLTIFIFFKSTCEAAPPALILGEHSTSYMSGAAKEEASDESATTEAATSATTEAATVSTSVSVDTKCEDSSFTDSFTMKFNLDSSHSVTPELIPKLSAGIAIKVTGSVGSVKVELGFCENGQTECVLGCNAQEAKVCVDSDRLKDIQTRTSCKQKAEKLSIGSQPLYVKVSGYYNSDSQGTITIEYDASLSLPITKNMLPWWGWLIVGIAILIVIVVVFLKFGLEGAKSLWKKISSNTKVPPALQDRFPKPPKPATA